MKNSANNKAAGFKGLLIEHVEKAILGILAILGLYFIYAGFKQESLSEAKKPERLTESVNKANQEIEFVKKLPLNEEAAKFKTTEYNKLLSQSMQPVSITDSFSGPYLTNPPIFRPIEKRKQPSLETVRDVQVVVMRTFLPLVDPKQIEKIAEQQKALLNEKNQKAAADALKKQLAEEKKRLQDERRQQTGNKGGRGGGEGGSRPLLTPPTKEPPALDPLTPATPVVTDITPPHPYLENIKGVVAVPRNIAVITALIPYKQMVEEYHAALIEGHDPIPDRKPEEDFPTVANIVLQRAEFKYSHQLPDATTKWVDISHSGHEFIKSNIGKLELAADEVAPQLKGPDMQIHKDRQITFRPLVGFLPRLADRKWQRAMTHPRIPLLSDLTDEDLTNLPTDMLDTTVVVQPNATATDQFTGAEVVEMPEYLLFRQFDPDVPDSENFYRYRVQLVFRNPNFGVADKYLDADCQKEITLGAGKKARLNTVAEIPGNFSEISNPAKLPPARAVLAGGSVTPSRVNGFLPKTKIWQWRLEIPKSLQEQAREVALEVPSISIGDLLEQVGTIKNILNRTTGQGETLNDYKFTWSAPGGAFAYLVDIMGGEKVPGTDPRKPKELPSEIIYADTNGRLRSSNSDQASVLIDNYKARYEQLEENNAAGPGAPGLGAPGGVFNPFGGAPAARER
jgi:hypothetical protein